MVDCSRRAQSLNRLAEADNPLFMKGKLRRLSCKYVTKKKFQRGVYLAYPTRWVYT